MVKYLLIGDTHSTSIMEAIQKVYKHTQIDSVISTGDFDDPTLVTGDMVKIMKSMDSYFVVGNHDLSYAIEEGKIVSGTSRETFYKKHPEIVDEYCERTTRMKYYDLAMGQSVIVSGAIKDQWDKTPTAKKLVKAAWENGITHDQGNCKKGRFGKILQTYMGKMKALIVHGGLAGSCGKYSDEDKNRVWYRQESIQDFEENFKKMGDTKIMIRGHDHDAQYIRKDPQTGTVSYDIDFNSPETTTSFFRLFEHRQHIVNPGALCDGQYAIIDTAVDGETSPILSFHKFV